VNRNRTLGVGEATDNDGLLLFQQSSLSKVRSKWRKADIHAPNMSTLLHLSISSNFIVVSFLEADHVAKFQQ